MRRILPISHILKYIKHLGIHIKGIEGLPCANLESIGAASDSLRIELDFIVTGFYSESV